MANEAVQPREYHPTLALYIDTFPIIEELVRKFFIAVTGMKDADGELALRRSDQQEITKMIRAIISARTDAERRKHGDNPEAREAAVAKCEADTKYVNETFKPYQRLREIRNAIVHAGIRVRNGAPGWSVSVRSGEKEPKDIEITTDLLKAMIDDLEKIRYRIMIFNNPGLWAPYRPIAEREWHFDG